MTIGKLIVFEGCEGSGKTSVINELKNLLPKDKVCFCSDPSKELDETIKLREILLSNKYSLTPQSELLLYTACRAELVNKIIYPALYENKIVICDRFILSTLVYQGHIRGFNKESIWDLHNKFCNSIMPDITFLCDVDPEVGLKRSLSRLGKNNIDESRWEEMDLSIHKRINLAFRDGLINFNNSHILISTNTTIENMACYAYYHIKKEM